MMSFLLFVKTLFFCPGLEKGVRAMFLLLVLLLHSLLGLMQTRWCHEQFLLSTSITKDLVLVDIYKEYLASADFRVQM